MQQCAAVKSERALYESVLSLDLFGQHGIEFCEEFPFLGKFVDLVGVSRLTSELFAVEIKLRDWKRVLWQARLCQLFADRVYVALWHQAGRRANCDFLRKSGIGLILVEPEGAKLHVEADRSNVLSPAARAHARKRLLTARSAPVLS